MHPFYTVVMPLYNKRSVVQRAVCSVLQQSFEDLEMIIIDDGSTDGSVDEIRNLTSDSRVRVLETENFGAASARNTGIDLASGKYIAFIDADDEWDHGFLAYMHQLIEENPSRIVFSSAYTEVSAIERKERLITYLGKFDLQVASQNIIEAPDYFQKLIEAGFSINNSSTTVIDRNYLSKYRVRFPIRQKYYEDHYVWYSLISIGGLVYGPRVLVNIYKDAENRSHSSWTARLAIDSLVQLKMSLDIFYSGISKTVPGYVSRTINKRAEYIARVAIRQSNFEEYKYVISTWPVGIVYQFAKHSVVFYLYKRLAGLMSIARKLKYMRFVN